jgi:hypothetical protein
MGLVGEASPFWDGLLRTAGVLLELTQARVGTPAEQFPPESAGDIVSYASHSSASMAMAMPGNVARTSLAM